MVSKVLVLFFIFAALLLSGCINNLNNNNSAAKSDSTNDSIPPIGPTNNECGAEVKLTSNFASAINAELSPFLKSVFGEFKIIGSENIDSIESDGIRIIYCLQNDLTQENIDSLNSELLKQGKLTLVSNEVHTASASYKYEGNFAGGYIWLNINYYYTLVMPHKIEITAGFLENQN